MYSKEQIIRSMEYCIRQYEHATEFSSCAYLMKSPDDDGNEYYCKYYGGRCNDRYEMLKDALAMLKEQDEEHRRLLSWLGKFCRHIDNGDAWLTDEENIAFFKEKMKQQFGWDTD